MFKNLLCQIRNPLVYSYFKTPFQYVRRRRDARKLIKRYSVTKQSENSPNVVFIVIDCLRYDHTSMSGYERDTTPNLQQYSKKGWSFSKCYSPSSWTYPTVTSLLSGRYQHNHGGRDTGESFSQPYPEVLFLSEILEHFDYQTVVFSDIYPTILAMKGKTKDFIHYHKNKANPLTLMDCQGVDFQKNFFLYFHLGDLHLPIKLDEEFQDVFGKIDTSISGLNSEWKYSKADIHKSGFPAFKENRIKLYDAKLRQIDSLVKDIVSKISELSTRDTLFVITADHGEEFWDHAEMENQYFHNAHDDFGVGHGYNLFQEIIHVPLILYSNSMHSGVSTENVSLVDVTPTILEQLSINHQIPVDGTSLFKKREKNVIFSEGVRARLKKKAVIKGYYKLIVSEANDASLLFNLKEDPLESTPLDNPRLENELKCEFPDAPTNLRKEKLQSDVIKERLNELGYF